MRYLIPLFFILIWFACKNTVKEAAPDRVSSSDTISRADTLPFRLHDTLFFIKNTYQQVFIDPDKSGKNHQKLIDLQWNTKTYAQWEVQRAKIREQDPNVLKKHVLKRLPRHWLPLEQYKGQLYLYKPCDNLFRHWVTIEQDAVIFLGGEAPEWYPIQGVQKFSPDLYELLLDSRFGEPPYRRIKIHLKGDMAIFECIRETYASWYLMCDAEKVLRFPLIINDCPERKAVELNFEDPDFKKILE
jgi:hypothetical protein